jgi:hypothetical protein
MKDLIIQYKNTVNDIEYRILCLRALPTTPEIEARIFGLEGIRGDMLFALAEMEC